MIIITDSNVFNTDAKVIVNTINCVGFMGKGLAFEFSLRYPDLLTDYKKKCENKEIMIGKIYYYKSDDQLIVNFPTKIDYKYPSKIEWIEKGLIDFVNTYQSYNIDSIAFPLLGSSNGKLNYQKIIDLIYKYLENLNLKVYICLDKKNPEGKELEMINKFKTCNIELLSKYIHLNINQINSLKSIQNDIKRFYQISKLEGIGFKTYRDIYQFFYKNPKIDYLNQQSLF